MTEVAIISSFGVTTPPEDYGGLERIAYDLAVGLSKYYNVTLIASKGSKKGNYKLIEAIDPFYGREDVAYEKYKRYLSKFDVIIDHTHYFYAYRLKQRYPNIKVIKTVHDLLPWQTPPPLDSFDRLVAVSRFHSEFLSVRYSLPVDFIYNGVFSKPSRNCPHNGDYLLFLSRIDPVKGAHVFLRLSRFGYKLVMAGEDSPYRGIKASYRDYIIYESNRRGVKYYGRVSEEQKDELLCNASAVVVPLQPPYWEVFGIWMVEALQRGTMVITTDRGSPKEILGDQGIVVKRNLGKTVDDFMNGRLTVGTPEGRVNRSQMFSVDNMVQKYRDLIETLIS